MTHLVREFHEKMGLEQRDTPGVPDDPGLIYLRARLILEETAEVVGALFHANDIDVRALADAYTEQLDVMLDVMRESRPAPDMRPSLVDLTKELADLRYVTEGCAVTFGLPLDEAYAAVHASNMSKGGERREDGKVLKGPDYVPAEERIAQIMAHDPVARATGEASGR